VIRNASRPDAAAFIRGLLENVGADIDPIRLVRRIGRGLEIQGLRAALIKILRDYHGQESLLRACASILDADARALSSDLHRARTRARRDFVSPV